MSIEQLLHVLRSRWKLVLLSTVLVFAVALIVSAVLPKRYTATASVLAEARSIDPVSGGLASVTMLPGYVATQIDIISSERVARRVVKMLGLDKSPEAVQRWRDEAEGLGTVENYYAGLLAKGLEVVPGRESNVISISFHGADPKVAASIANAFARAYVETSLELKVDPAREYASWFVDRTKQLRDNLEQAQTRLSAFQRDKGIVSVDDRLDVENARLAELSTQLAASQAQRADTASRQRQASSSMDTSPDVLQNPVVSALRADVARQEAKLKDLSGQLGVNHPQYQRSLAELVELKAKLDAEMRQVAASVGSAAQANVFREGTIRGTIDTQKQRILALRQQRDELAVLQRDVESAQKAYDLVAQRLSQLSLESQSQQTNISVLDAAAEPTSPSSPKSLRNALLGLVLGCALGVGVALLLELIDPRVRSVGDLRHYAGVPVLAELPEIRPSGIRRRKVRRAAAEPTLAQAGAHV
ncbi:chain length determinant protein EpsF [Niveibacterium sp. SC-1]|uniref:chain length determinant protein EpsF n=1 Tax=Niveibacterium sp. SC-1 TaxID=3135646 RepID=UPI00311ECFB2